jgi:hypothetical protein
VSDITIERCVLWPTVANVFRTGWINQSLTTRHITLRDCDVIHIGRGEWMGAAWALFTAVSPNGQGECRHSDYLFENIRVEERAALLGVNWAHTHLDNFQFKDIRFRSGIGTGILSAESADIGVEQVRVNDQPVTNLSDLKLTVTGAADHVRIAPGVK